MAAHRAERGRDAGRRQEPRAICEGNTELSDFVADEFIAFLDRRGGIEGTTSDPDVTAAMRRLNARLPEGSAIIFTYTKSDFAPGGLGTQIMAALSRQIEGTWSLKPGEAGGTCFTLTWPAAEVQTRLPVLA